MAVDTRLDRDEKKVVKSVIESILIKHGAKRWLTRNDSQLLEREHKGLTPPRHGGRDALFRDHSHLCQSSARENDDRVLLSSLKIERPLRRLRQRSVQRRWVPDVKLS